ncbi:MAG: hypothetical protein ACO1TE_24945 [Prosthecobacter sp.]
MKRFTTLALIAVSISFAGLKLAQAQAVDTSRAACMKKCTETFKTCKQGAGADKGRLAACTSALKACVKLCPAAPAVQTPPKK